VVMSAEAGEEYRRLVAVSSLVTDLVRFVNDEVREQQNWRKTLDIYSRLDKRPIEQSTHPVLVELRVCVKLSLIVLSRDPQRCCEAVQSAILATAWLLVNMVNIGYLQSS